MKKNKLYIDITMIIVLFLVMNTKVTGILFHEILGICIWELFLMHLVINLKWIKSISKVIFKNQLKSNIKKIYIIDLLLFVDFIFITLSGILISQKLFVFINADNIYFWTIIHKSTSYLAILILLIHLIMHFNFFEGFINKLIKNKNISKMLTTLLIIATLSAFAFSSVVSIVQSFFVSKKYSTSSVENDSNISSDDTTEDNTDDSTEEETNESIKEDTDSSDSEAVEEETEDVITLSEYLSSLICTGCGKRCPLSHPRCGRGETRAAAATENYYDTYE